MSIEHANMILSEFADRIGLPSLALDERAYACLSFDDLMVGLEYIQKTDAIVLSSWFTMQASRREELLVDLLEENFSATARGEAVFCYERMTDVIVLTHSLSLLGLTPQSFESQIEGLLKAAFKWRARVQCGDETKDEHITPSLEEFMLFRA